MSVFLTLALVPFAFVVGILYFSIRRELRRIRHRDGYRPRGAAPGDGLAVVSSTMLDSHQHSWYVPRDPQQYAKAFVPAHAKKDN